MGDAGAERFHDWTCRPIESIKNWEVRAKFWSGCGIYFEALLRGKNIFRFKDYIILVNILFAFMSSDSELRQKKSENKHWRDKCKGRLIRSDIHRTFGCRRHGGHCWSWRFYRIRYWLGYCEVIRCGCVGSTKDRLSRRNEDMTMLHLSQTRWPKIYERRW